jgi:hypothetical protein
MRYGKGEGSSKEEKKEAMKRSHCERAKVLNWTYFASFLIYLTALEKKKLSL